MKFITTNVHVSSFLAGLATVALLAALFPVQQIFAATQSVEATGTLQSFYQVDTPVSLKVVRGDIATGTLPVSLSSSGGGEFTTGTLGGSCDSSYSSTLDLTIADGDNQKAFCYRNSSTGNDTVTAEFGDPVIGQASVGLTFVDSPYGSSPTTQVTICHHNEGNGGGFTANTVSVTSSGAPQGGHDATNGAHAPDVIPPYFYTDGNSDIQYYAGKNWDTDGEVLWNSGGCDGGDVVVPVPGCTDTGANNWDSTATEDDGSCLYDLTIIKVVIGETNPDYTQFLFSLNGASSVAFDASGTNVIEVGSSTHTVVEDAAAGYSTTYSNCEAIDVTANDAICTITNTVQGTAVGTLMVEKEIVGGPAAVVSDFMYSLNGAAAVAFAASGTEHTLVASTSFTVTEQAAAGYTVTTAGCSGTVVENSTSICTITNTWIPTCSDGIQNQDETGVDVGGACDTGGPTPSACQIGDNLLVNGSFEDPVADANYHTPSDGYWEIFASVPGWVTTNGIELWNGLFNGPSDGDQNAELGTDQASSITQTVSTVAGATYELSFDYAARPNTAEATNHLAVNVDDIELFNQTSSSTDWVTHTVSFEADDSTDISFSDVGTSDGLGTLLDNAVLCYVSDPEVETYLVFGYVWHDDNENEFWEGFDDDSEEREDILAGWKVTITDGKTELSTTTDSDGYYYFNVPEGTWTITEEVEDGWERTTQQSHVVTVPEVFEEDEQSDFFTMLREFIIPTAHAQAVSVTYGPYNFGNNEEDSSSNSGGGGGTRVDRTPSGSVLGAATTSPLVLGEQVSAVPVGAPDTGKGGSAERLVQTLTASLRSSRIYAK